ncbi:hypothetical protein TNCV_1872061 [Trichonephila clavipes]|nr:hypothetical protein TNCV_1872061 [Trichonephila clavipes]
MLLRAPCLSTRENFTKCCIVIRSGTGMAYGIGLEHGSMWRNEEYQPLKKSDQSTFGNMFGSSLETEIGLNQFKNIEKAYKKDNTFRGRTESIKGGRLLTLISGLTRKVKFRSQRRIFKRTAKPADLMLQNTNDVLANVQPQVWLHVALLRPQHVLVPLFADIHSYSV